MKQNARLLLFENRVYSTDPNYWEEQFLGPDILYYHLFSDHTDEQLMYILDPKKAANDLLSAGNKLYILDDVVTIVRNQIRNDQRKQRKRWYDFDCARKIIVDDRYPVFERYTRKFKRWTGNRRMRAQMGHYTITFGRVELIEMIASMKYKPAIPELREVFLHDVYSVMQSTAVAALRRIGTEKAAQCVRDLFFEKGLSNEQTYMLIDAAERLPYEIVVKGLHNAFTENYLFYTEKYHSIDLQYETTLQQKILKVCSKIPSLSALQILEMGIAHPYSHVEATAYNQLKEWTKLMLVRIEIGKDDGYGLEIAKIIKKYDFAIFSESYKRLKKNQVLLPVKC